MNQRKHICFFPGLVQQLSTPACYWWSDYSLRDEWCGRDCGANACHHRATKCVHTHIMNYTLLRKAAYTTLADDCGRGHSIIPRAATADLRSTSHPTQPHPPSKPSSKHSPTSPTSSHPSKHSPSSTPPPHHTRCPNPLTVDGRGHPSGES